MQRRRRLRSSDKEVIAFITRLPQARLGPSYTERDRAIDFKQVFGTDQGQRVLAQIMDFCNPPPIVLTDERPGLMADHNGRRVVGAKIMRAFLEMKAKPTQEKTEGVESDV